MFHNKQLEIALVLLTGCILMCAGQIDVSLNKSKLGNVEPGIVNDLEAVEKEKTTTTTPKPEPFPAPSAGQWSSSCIMVKMAVQLHFNYTNKDDKISTALYNVPPDAIVFDSVCDSNAPQSIHINWGPKEAPNSMMLVFEMKNGSVKMTMMRFVLALTADAFPDANVKEIVTLIHRLDEFDAPANMSYLCMRAQQFNLTGSVMQTDLIGTATVHGVQTEAFRSSNATQFSTEYNCATPTTTSTTTTVAPSTTTTTVAPITTTTAKPGPYPDPTAGQWNSSCMMVKMAAQLHFNYTNKDNKSSTALYNVPADAIVSSSLCDSNTTQNILITWGPMAPPNSMMLQFDMKNETVKMTMMRFELTLTADAFPDAKINETVSLMHRLDEFGAPVKMSYHCTRAQTFNLTESVPETAVVGTVTVQAVQAEAFRSGNGTQFSTVHDCDSSNTSDMVPIAVGIALISLIVIVLVAYLCARRRSISRGYVNF